MAASGRRTALAGLLSLPALAPGRAWAAFPERDVRLLVGFSAGGAVDLLARLLAEPLRPVLGQNVVVDNRSGASGLIAAEAAAFDPALLPLLQPGPEPPPLLPVRPGQARPSPSAARSSSDAASRSAIPLYVCFR